MQNFEQFSFCKIYTSEIQHVARRHSLLHKALCQTTAKLNKVLPLLTAFYKLLTRLVGIGLIFRLEDRSSELRIYTDPEKYYYNDFNEKRRKKSWRQLERELIKAAGVFWCEFQYCFEKETLYKRANAIVKCQSCLMHSRDASQNFFTLLVSN